METTNEIIIHVPSLEPRMKHTTIFQTFNNLNPGESMVIHNDHDPKPVYYQLQGIYGDIFSWEYLQDGPDWWQIRISKNAKEEEEKPENKKEHLTINVQEIEPRLRHMTIFQEFDNLNEGQSLVIHNNHDPKPVYFQLQQLKGDCFDWEYLEAGPEWWDVLVTKRKPLAPQGISHTHQGEIVITVPEIEPRMKHETIFNTFAGLKPGESMIIHNDHDPKPVYYQLRSMHGDTFSWDYLQQGPEWWDIRVAKNPERELSWEEQVGHALSKNEQNDTVINIPSLAPKLKHATIFRVFEDLNPGESLVIHNDHDPKPVYYQLLGEYGTIFSWTYLQEGPIWWDIRVSKVNPDEQETIGEISAKDLRKAEVFKKYGIDFSCGGNKTLKQACDEKGLEVEKVEKELNQAVDNVLENQVNYADWDVDFLVDYVKNIHHNYARKYLPELKQYATKVAQVHGDAHPELLPLKDKVDSLYTNLEHHLKEEETVLFPLVKKIFEAKKENNIHLKYDNGNFEKLSQQLEKEHFDFVRVFEEIHQLTQEFALPEDACASYKLLFQMLQEFEKDLQLHFHIENNILFPKTIEIEKSLETT
ncbi:MAG: iron-sulfur cluster repair di-iron protein [Weeksellaceae bacterium]|jgi:regulator of cell morphogenesis and NO signaling|nr:iron-sulfur cluster repair di-iron protein [Weeksellaceae bacterium]MDX9704388.1 iron-sulfur cluster repair di-iron protein [Weeksellaceae bacterium]